MPVRVKCRCGEEMVLRYSEWVYLLVGLSIVGFLSTLVAVIVLHSRLGALQGDLDALRKKEDQLALRAGGGPKPDSKPESKPESESQPQPESKRELDSDSDPDSDSDSDSDSVAVRESDRESVSQPQPEPGSQRESASETVARADTAPVPPWKPSRVLRPPGEPLIESPADLLSELEKQLRGAEKGGDSNAQPSARRFEERLLVDSAPLVRLLFLGETTTYPVITAALLLDPDPRIADQARDVLLAKTPTGGAERSVIAPLIEAARPRLSSSREGTELLRRLGLSQRDAALAEPSRLEEAWSQATSISEGVQKSLPLVNQWDAILGSTNETGTDLLLVVDTTRSMHAGLTELKAACSWLLPALEWGAPGLRVGLLPYKDEIVATHDLSERPGSEVLPGVLELEPQGGGDVPEGVDTAIRGALELGRFSWRPEAKKHIVVIGDAPPRYQAVRGLRSLVAACRQQDGFRVHVLGVYPKENGSVPFFAQLAEDGGGRGPTCRPGELHSEVLLCLFGEEARPSLRRFEERVRKEFGGV